MARRSQPVPPCVADGTVVRRVVLRARDVVFFKGVIEASEGLAGVYAERGGDLTVVAPLDREAELDAVLSELCAELQAVSVRSP
jgi:hypothetical protein